MSHRHFLPRIFSLKQFIIVKELQSSKLPNVLRITHNLEECGLNEDQMPSVSLNLEVVEEDVGYSSILETQIPESR